MEARLKAVAAALAPYARVADIGAGSGQLTKHLAASGHTVIAVDVSPHAVHQLRHSLDSQAVHVVQGDGLEPLDVAQLDALCIAGLGGRAMARLLLRRPPPLGVALVLQPMQDVAALVGGLRILDRGVGSARLVASGGRVYAVFVSPPNCRWNGPDDVQWDKLGWWLRPDPLWTAWVEQEIAKLRRRLRRMRLAGENQKAAVRRDILWLEAQRSGQT
jgi:tRNA A22 N-methylase